MTPRPPLIEERNSNDEYCTAEETCTIATTVGPPDSSDVLLLRLNVGGTKMEVVRRALTILEDSRLASRFSGRWDDSIEKDFREKLLH